MKKYLLTLSGILLTLLVSAQSFQGTMSRQTLDQYLSRSITMAGLVEMSWCAWGPCASVANGGLYTLNGYNEDIDMLTHINARFVGRVVGMWGGEAQIPAGYMAQAKRVADDINAKYQNAGLEKPILQAAIFEIVTADASKVMMSPEVANAYGITARYFNYQAMRYRWNRNPDAATPDMSQLETQMWYYYLATQYIDAGYEAIHFGQAEIIDDADPNHEAWWRMLSMVRAYAATKNRGLVLCDAHTNGLYYDPFPEMMPPAEQRQLLFDFHSSPLCIREDAHQTWVNTNSGGGGGATLDGTRTGCAGTPIYGHSAGGLTYFGWSTASLPFLAEFDNFGITTNPGYYNNSCFPWGWDEITWFALRTNNYRNAWLKYAYYKVPCLDPNGHLEMPGIRNMTEKNRPWPGRYYRASNGPEIDGHFNQQDMIQRLWDGAYSNDWSLTAVVSQSTPDVKSNSVSVGDNVFYIATDGRVHGYLKSTSSWYSVNVAQGAAYSAGQSINSQVQAEGCLTASPDGHYLFYRGTDGELYGYALNIFTYTYFKVSSSTLQAPEKVKSDLVCTKNNFLYYISESQQVYAYIPYGSQWIGTSPTWIAHGTINVSQQTPAAGSLVLNPSDNMLYYRGTDSYIHGYRINGPWSYDYFDLPKIFVPEEMVTGQLVCATDTRLYYVGQGRRIYGMLLNAPYGQTSTPSYGGVWGKISPSWSSELGPSGLYHEQSDANGMLAASPDGSLLAYDGGDYTIHGYRVLNDYSSEFFEFSHMSFYDRPTTGIRFKSNTDLFYISNYGRSYRISGNNKLYEYQLGPVTNVCSNPSIALFDYPYSYSSLAPSEPAPQQESLVSSEGVHLNVFPNPATSVVQIELTGATYSATPSVQMQDIYGRVLKQAELKPANDATSLTATIEVSDVVEGTYLIKVVGGLGKGMVRKLAVVH